MSEDDKIKHVEAQLELEKERLRFSMQQYFPPSIASHYIDLFNAVVEMEYCRGRMSVARELAEGKGKK